MRLIRTVLLLAILVVLAIVGYNYWSGNGLTLRPAAGGTGVDAEEARRRGAALTREAAKKTSEAAGKIEVVVNESALTAKIKSKMVLDDNVKSRTIDVDTSGSIVTLSGVVQSNEERERAVRLARETDGVTRVIDKLDVKPR
jgi:hyperosmotically inducible protein